MTADKLNGKIKKTLCLSLTVAFLIALCGVYAQALERVEKEIIIRVQSGIIALPGNKVVKVPIDAARVRSGDLRRLNDQYNAVIIEKLFVLEKNAGIAGINEVFRNETKKEKIARGEKAVEAEDMFLIEFELDPAVDMEKLLKDYLMVGVILQAKEINRDK